MTTLSTAPAGRPTDRIDGIDVTQLLCDIGEASANANSIELFRLCLDAQRVLNGLFSQGARV